MNTIVVTVGTIGDHVADALTTRGAKVRTLRREDFASAETLGQAFAGAEQFFSVTPFVENLVELAGSTIDAAKAAGVTHVVRSSVLGADPSAASAMHRWHAAVEDALHGSGMSYTILRPNTFFQSTLMNAPSIASQNAFYLPQGDGAVSMIDARDIADVAVRTLLERGHEGKTYTLTGSEALTNQQVAQKLSTALGRPIQYVDVSEDQAASGMASSGMPAWQVAAMLEFMRFCKDGKASHVYPDARDIAGRDLLTFDSFLKENAAAFSSGTVRSSS